MSQNDTRPGNPEVSDEVLAIISDDGSSQPTASRTVEHGEYDVTSLTPKAYADAVHRDWIAHWSRWAWAGKWIKKGDRVLEPGCGRESMLLRHLRTNTSSIPSLYVGVDLDKIRFEKERNPGVCKWGEVKSGFNFVTQQDELAQEYGEASFDKIVSFEVYEHITPAIGIEYLDACRRFLASDGILLLSTPVFNGKKAANHIREYTTDELRAIIEDRGFKILDRFGTFASYHDVKKGIREQYSPSEADSILKVYERVREFHSDALLAGMLAPLVPDHSRNNVWVCVKA